MSYYIFLEKLFMTVWKWLNSTGVGWNAIPTPLRFRTTKFAVLYFRNSSWPIWHWI